MEYFDYLLMALVIALYAAIGMILTFYLDGLAYRKDRELYDYQLRQILIAWPLAAPLYWWKIISRG